MSTVEKEWDDSLFTKNEEHRKLMPEAGKTSAEMPLFYG